jgi:hypothetical protein
MIKQIRFLIGIILALAVTGTALAQGPIETQHTAPYWDAAYWNNTALSGPPAVQRADADLNNNWGTGSPAPGVNADGFSARWTRYIDVTPANYRFTVTADDGMRLWVDTTLLIDQWKDQGPTTYTADTYLGPGHHLVKVEYYENMGIAVAQVSWAQVIGPGGGWRGEYYNNKSLSGAPALVRDDPQINFNWGGGSPAPGVVAADGFSVRWSRSQNMAAGNYRFSMTVDDGARLYVNGHLLIDAWKDQAPTSYFGDIYLPGGAVTLQMEYYENAGGAVAQLSSGGGDQPPPPPPPPDAVGVVTASRLNVRTGPSLNHPVIALLQRGQQVRLLGRNSAASWLKVELAPNYHGWVFASYIRSSVPITNLPVVQ